MNTGYLKSLRIVHFALAAGIVLFLFISLFLNFSTGAFMGNTVPAAERLPYIIILILVTGGIFIAYRIVISKKLESIKKLTSLDEKLIAWRELVVLRGALIEGPAFFAIVIFLLLGLHIVLVWPFAGLVLFWFLQPTRERLYEEAQLSDEEMYKVDSANE